MEQDASRPAADGRADGRILEVETGERSGGGIGAYHAGGSIGRRLFLLVVLLRDGIRRRQLTIARGFACRARRLRQITEQLSFGLLERGAVRTGIDLEQDLSRAYLITFGEMNMQDGAVHLRPHIHRTKWLDRPVRP